MDINEWLEINKYIKINEQNVRLKDVFDVTDYLVPPEGFSILSFSGLLILFGSFIAIVQIGFIVAVLVKIKKETNKLADGNGDIKAVMIALLVLFMGLTCTYVYFNYLKLLFEEII